jgi:hypothetical protein
VWSAAVQLLGALADEAKAENRTSLSHVPLPAKLEQRTICRHARFFIPPTEAAVRHTTILALLVLPFATAVWPSEASAQNSQPERARAGVLRAGAAAVDITPEKFPVLINGGFLANRATRAHDPVRAKCLVLDDGATRLAIVVVDTCMMPRELLDRAKEMARARTGIPTERILISATHTHSAPAVMGALGCAADPNYTVLLPGWIAESIERASRNLERARIGWNVIDDPAHTFCRRWIRRPDKMLDDPFGQRTVRANMHPGYQNPDAIGPSGPVDPGLTLLSVQSRAGRPIAVLANYSMHYYGYGVEPVSADYFGRFAAGLARRISAEFVDPPFVGIISQGTSGDQAWMDYGGPRKDPGVDVYAGQIAQIAFLALQASTYHEQVPLAMAETTLTLRRRVPDEARLAWARAIVARMKERDAAAGTNQDGALVPRNQPEVYAKEALFLHEEQERTLKLQAIRIGELGITAIPNEVFAVTGLKIKAQSPFDTTMNIELANGSEGYIPPPEQHALGGYTTWPARTAALEVQAEPKILATVLDLLERVAGKARRELRLVHGPYAQAVLASRPQAYWRLDDIQGASALDSTGNARHGSYHGGVAFYLPGAGLPGLSAGTSINRAVHFAGGLLHAQLGGTGESYSVELWFWNGLPVDVPPINGYLFASSSARAGAAPGDQVGIGGSDTARRRLFFTNGSNSGRNLVGKTEVTPRTWHHLAFVRERAHVTVFLDGNPEPEIGGDAGVDAGDWPRLLSIGARNDRVAGFEGKIDEVAVYDRALSASEVSAHVRAAATE